MTGVPDRATPLIAFGSHEPVDRGRPVSSPKAVPAPGASFAAVVLFDDLAASRAIWLQLQDLAPASPYQTFAWNEAWLQTEGAATGVQPLICVATDAENRPLALLPLGLKRTGLAAVASFLGGRHSNYNIGLFLPSVMWSARDLMAFLQGVVAASGRPIDVFALTNQPQVWAGWHNPMALLPRQASPSQSHSVRLEPDGDRFLRDHLSANVRKKMRSKAAHLATHGPVRHLAGRSDEEIDTIVEAHIAQKAVKFAGMPRADLMMARRLLMRATRSTGTEPAGLEMHALLCGDRIVATFGGLSHKGRFSGLVISHDGDPTFARSSPGELLLAEVIRVKCREGATSFDLGIGEDRYKQSLCPDLDPLFDSLVPVSVYGRLFTAREAMRLRLKAAIKNSPRLWALVNFARRRFAPLQPR